MAKTTTEQKEEKQIQKKQVPHQEQQIQEFLVRILSYDIPGSRNVYAGLTKIKGVSWSISNVVCLKLNIPRKKKIGELTKEDIEKIQTFLKSLQIQDYLKNHRFQFESGETKHYLGTDLDMVKDFDIRRLKKIRSYKGVRHSSGLPVRGQRTRSHFRTRGGASGVKRKK
ncbi:MAG: 30S ribosomal protein S13 [Nanoarchaeota archaeon]|nr:30S ribosomal protein S13 [Nanoarchaeota archaeon]